MKKNNEWHFNKDYRTNVSTANEIFFAIVVIATLIAIIYMVNNKGYEDYHWDYEEYTVMEGDTVYDIEQEYYNTWCVGVKISFQEYRYEVEKRSDIENVNKVRPGDKIVLPINPTKR